MLHRLVATRRRKLAAAATVAVLVAAGAAFAAWLVVSSGSAKGRAGSLTAPTVVEAEPTTYAKPGTGNEGSMAISVTNPTENGALVLTSATWGSVSGGNGSCPTSNALAIDQTTLSIAVPTGTTTIQIPGALRLLATAPSACQGVYFTANGNFTFSTP